MRPDQTLLLLLSFSAVLLLPFASAGDFKASQIDVPFCKRTDYPVLCVYAAHTYGHKYPTITPMSLLSMHVEMATDHTKAARAVARFLISKNRHANHRVKDAFNVCMGMFNDALDELATGLDAARRHDAGTANSMLSAAITYYSTCDDAFKEIPAPSPMARQNGFLRKMVSNALALGQLFLH